MEGSHLNEIANFDKPFRVVVLFKVPVKRRVSTGYK